MKVDLNEGLKRVRYVVYAIILVIAAWFIIFTQYHRYFLFVETYSPDDGWHYTSNECDYHNLSIWDKFRPAQAIWEHSPVTGDLYNSTGNRTVPSKLKFVVRDIATCYRANSQGIVPIDPSFRDNSHQFADTPTIRYIRNRDDNITISDDETQKIIKIVTPIVVINYIKLIAKALFWSLLIMGIIEATSRIIGWVVRGFARRTEP